ncbi:MAG: helix-turn-helix domain-containing protein [Thermomicrobiales bacterium]
MKADEASSFGELLRHFSTRAAVSHSKLADQAGLSEDELRNLERGANSNPTLEHVQRLAEALNLDQDQTASLLAARGAAVSALHEKLEAARPPQLRIPVPPQKLIGREREIEAILNLLNQPDLRLLTLTGPGGIGKTRLALTIAARVDAAKRYAEGVYFVDLSSTTDPALVVNAIAQAVGVRTASGRSLEDVLADFL